MQEPSLTSGNNFGATYWTDGVIDAPMWPNLSAIGACPKCRGVFWFKDAEQISEFPLFAPDDSVPAELRELQNASVLDEEQLLNSIDDGLGDSTENLDYLRLAAWHALNDRFRIEEPNPSFELNERQRANLEELEKRFRWPESWDDSFILAEVCRQLGKFEKAQSLLRSINVEFVLARKTLVAQLCQKQSKLVAMIPKPDPSPPYDPPEESIYYPAVPCPYCGETLRTAIARQCRFCKMDWHDAQNIHRRNTDHS